MALSAFEHIRGALLIAPFAIHLLVADLLISLLLPASFVLPTLVYDLSSALAWTVWLHIQLLFESVNGAPIMAFPAPVAAASALPRHESAIVLANHVSWADFYLIQHLARSAGMLGRCRWFVKAQLARVPLLGWGLWAMGMPMVSRDWTHDRAQLSRLFRGPADRGWPVWLVSYCEATRFTPAKYAATLAWCARERRRPPRHLLYPRFKGFVATVEAMRRARRGQVRAVYDVTVGYARRVDGRWRFMQAPSMWETVARPNLGRDYRFYVHVQRFELAALPVDKGDLELWLESRWVEKGERLEELRKSLEEESGRADGLAGAVSGKS